jgi:hypothetical protein
VARRWEAQMQAITFRCTEETFGMPDPHIPDGAYIILVQNGRAEVGRYEEPRPPDEPMPMFDHPANVDELAADAMRAVQAAFPDIDPCGHARVFTCPPDLAARAVWRRAHRAEPGGAANWRPPEG